MPRNLFGLVPCLVLASCASRGPAPSAPAPEPPEPEAACLARHCAGSADPAACAAERCAPRAPTWAIVPERIRTDPATTAVYIQARVDWTPGGFGDVDTPRDRPVYVGVTLITPAGREIDLAVQTRFEADIEAPFFMSAEAGDAVEAVILGLWDRKVEPCDSERPGCKEFGFLLDGSLASWPPRIYEDGLRQRVPPQTVTLRFLHAGAPADALETARTAAREALQRELAMFEVTLEEAPVALAPLPRDHVAVLHAHPGDAPMARTLAALLGASADGGAPEGADVAVVLGGEGAAARHACLVQACGAAEDLPACAARACP